MPYKRSSNSLHQIVNDSFPQALEEEELLCPTVQLSFHFHFVTGDPYCNTSFYQECGFSYAVFPLILTSTLRSRSHWNPLRHRECIQEAYGDAGKWAQPVWLHSLRSYDVIGRRHKISAAGMLIFICSLIHSIKWTLCQVLS